MSVITDLPAEQLHAGIRAWSRGSYPLEAAAELLIRHDHWLRRTGFLERCAQISAEGPDYIAMRWADAAAAIDTAAASSSERAIALIATAIAGHPIPDPLGHLLSGLDRTNTDLVCAAISHATGTHQNVEHLATTRGGGPSVITPDSVRLHLDPIHPWPAKTTTD